MKQEVGNLSPTTFGRLPNYLRVLKKLSNDGLEYISSVGLSEEVNENPAVVKKDLSQVIQVQGRPKVGYYIKDLIKDIEVFLNYNHEKKAVLVGAGKLGQALLGYDGFNDLGLNIVAGFDTNPNLIGTEIHGKPILNTDKLKEVIENNEIKIAILTLPNSETPAVAEFLVHLGIRAFWNFSRVPLKLPKNIAIRNENMAGSLALLSAQLNEVLKKEKEGE